MLKEAHERKKYNMLLYVWWWNNCIWHFTKYNILVYLGDRVCAIPDPNCSEFYPQNYLVSSLVSKMELKQLLQNDTIAGHNNQQHS